MPLRQPSGWMLPGALERVLNELVGGWTYAAVVRQAEADHCLCDGYVDADAFMQAYHDRCPWIGAIAA